MEEIYVLKVEDSLYTNLARNCLSLRIFALSMGLLHAYGTISPDIFTGKPDN
jgi:hypothetical protein